MTSQEAIRGGYNAIRGLLPQDQALRYYQSEFSLIDSLLEEIVEKLHADRVRIEILMEKLR